MKTKYLITLFLTLCITSTAFSQKYKVAKIKKYSMERFYDVMTATTMDTGIMAGNPYIVFKVKSPQYSGYVIAEAQDWFYFLFSRLKTPKNLLDDKKSHQDFKKYLKNDLPYEMSREMFDSFKNKFRYMPNESEIYKKAKLGVTSFLSYYFEWDEHFLVYIWVKHNDIFNRTDENAMIFQLFKWGFYVENEDDSGYLVIRSLR